MRRRRIKVLHFCRKMHATLERIVMVLTASPASDEFYHAREDELRRRDAGAQAARDAAIQSALDSKKAGLPAGDPAKRVTEMVAYVKKTLFAEYGIDASDDTLRKKMIIYGAWYANYGTSPLLDPRAIVPSGMLTDPLQVPSKTGSRTDVRWENARDFFNGTDANKTFTAFKFAYY